MVVKEDNSAFVSALGKSIASAKVLYDRRNQLVDAPELAELIAGSLKLATLYSRFAYDMLLDASDEVIDNLEVNKWLRNVGVASGKLKMLESKDNKNKKVAESFKDPFSAEYLK